MKNRKSGHRSREAASRRRQVHSCRRVGSAGTQSSLPAVLVEGPTSIASRVEELFKHSVWRKRLRQREAYASWLQRSRRSCRWSRRSCPVSLPRLRCERGVCAHVGHVHCSSRDPALARPAAGVKDEAQRALSSQSSRGRRPGVPSPRALRVGSLREAQRGREGRGAPRLPRPPYGCGRRRARSGRAGGLGGHPRGLLAQPFGTYALLGHVPAWEPWEVF